MAAPGGHIGHIGATGGAARGLLLREVLTLRRDGEVQADRSQSAAPGRGCGPPVTSGPSREGLNGGGRRERGEGFRRDSAGSAAQGFSQLRVAGSARSGNTREFSKHACLFL